MTKEEKIKEILKLLDLTEEEQRKRISVYLDPPPWKHNFVAGFSPDDPEKCDKCGKKLRTKEDYEDECSTTYIYSGSLADLAFKLRDEMVGCSIKGEVPEYITGKVMPPPFPQSLFCWFRAKQTYVDAYLKTYRYPGNREAWWQEQSQPIHWIVASLIAKELNKREE